MPTKALPQSLTSHTGITPRWTQCRIRWKEGEKEFGGSGPWYPIDAWADLVRSVETLNLRDWGEKYYWIEYKKGPR